jgi:hypothetical protein
MGDSGLWAAWADPTAFVWVIELVGALGCLSEVPRVGRCKNVWGSRAAVGAPALGLGLPEPGSESAIKLAAGMMEPLPPKKLLRDVVRRPSWRRLPALLMPPRSKFELMMTSAVEARRLRPPEVWGRVGWRACCHRSVNEDKLGALLHQGHGT